MSEKRFMVTQYGIGKVSKKPYSIGKEIREDKNGTWGFIDEKSSFFLDEILPIGYYFEIEQTLKQTAEA